MKKNIMDVIIITPVYNDWSNIITLLHHLEVNYAGSGEIKILKVVIVNDGSSELFPTESLKTKLSVKILNLTVNIGHQRAIAVGLSYVYEFYKAYDSVIIMDSDGEDNPIYINDLCKKTASNNYNKIIFAERTKRSEGLSFRLFYKMYKLCFRFLTGKSISFGNFSSIPFSLVGRLVTLPDIWNHFSGSVIKSKLPFDKIPTARSKRYFGASKMNLQSLTIHGLSAISIYLESVIIKLLILSTFGIVVILIMIIIILFIRFATDLAIPGWASSVSLALINIGGILFIITLLLLLMQLNQRGNMQPSISNFYHSLIYSIDDIN